MSNQTIMLQVSVFIAAVLILADGTMAQTPPQGNLPLVPYPVSIETQPGAMALTAASRIVATDPALEPLAKLLSDEILTLHGLALATAGNSPATGDIVLGLDASLKGESHTIDVVKTATVKGAGYGAVAMGTMTLIQAMAEGKDGIALPLMKIRDTPAYGYRGLMIDTARNPHSIENLKQTVLLCRLYKVRYLHLHLNDDQSFLFPSPTYPQLTTQNWSVPAYTMSELKELVAFADLRGVTLIPELEGPGHCGALQRAFPEAFGTVDASGKAVATGCFNFMNPKLYPTLEILVREMSGVFKSSPYFHIGCDEVGGLEQIAGLPGNAGFLQENKLDEPHDMYIHYINKMNGLVKKHGKQTLVWEGFKDDGGKNIKIDKDVTVMEFEVAYNLPSNLVKHGYQMINASWTPLYVTLQTRHTPEHIYDWNPLQFGQVAGKGYDNVTWHNLDAPTPLLQGAQVCTWEQNEWAEIPSLRERLPAMAERVWNPASKQTFTDFKPRLAINNALYDRYPFGFTVATDKNAVRKTDFVATFRKTTTLTLNHVPEGVAVHYTLDGTAPGVATPAYTQPLAITVKDCKPTDGVVPFGPLAFRCIFKAQAFRDGKPLAGVKTLFFDNFDDLDQLPRKAHLKVYANPKLLNSRPDFATLKPTIECEEPHVWPAATQTLDMPLGTYLVYEGRIEAPSDGDYEFTLRSMGGGSQLYINHALVADRNNVNDWGQCVKILPLKKGVQLPFRVEYYASIADMFFVLDVIDKNANKPIKWTDLMVPLR
jgi:hexosaminidase